MKPALAETPAPRPMSRSDPPESCGGERAIDLALCLILACAVVGLLLLVAL